MVYHPDHPQRRSVYYDDNCELCEGTARKIRANIDLSTVGSSEELPVFIDKEVLKRDVLAMDEYGVMHRGIDAVIVILRWHPQGRFVAPILALPGIRQLGAGVYRIVANNRYRWFGKKT